MNTQLLLFCLGVATNAAAADSTAGSSGQPQPLAASSPAGAAAKPAALRRLPAPTISETSVTRQADGSLTMNCVQKPNPKLKPDLTSRGPAPHSTGPQQP